MKWRFALMFMLVPAIAWGQAASQIFTPPNGVGQPQPVSPSNPLPVNATVTATATTTATAAATPPSVSAGPGNPLIIDLHSALYVQPTFAGTPVDLTHGLPVSIVSGAGSGGTSSTFGAAFPSLGTAFGMSDGTNMLAVRGDNTNGLWVNIKAAVSQAVTNAGTFAVQDAGTEANTLAISTNSASSQASLTVIAGAISSNVMQSNTKQVNGVTTLAGAGASGTGSQRVTAAQDTTTIAGSAPGTAGTPSANVVSVQGVSGGTPLPVSGTVQPGNTPNTTPWLASVSQGGNTQAVKAASTAPVATDPAAVVSISPNSLTPTGTTVPAAANYIGNNVGGNLTGQIGCGSSIVYDASTNGATQLVALSAGQKIYVCGYSILAAGTVNVELDYGTGTACATGNNKMTPAYQLTAQVGIVDGSPIYRGLSTAASNELCLKTSAGVAVQAVVYYTQL